MDIATLRTFADLCETGVFTRTAERMNLTQSAISARIRVLEQEVGAKLFERSTEGARLTPAGERFRDHAVSLLHHWERVRFEARHPALLKASLSVGIHPTLWADFGEVWVRHIRRQHPDTMLRVEVDFSAAVFDQVSLGMLDMGLIFIEQFRKGVIQEEVYAEPLVMVSTRSGVDAGSPIEDYVLTDWGPGCNSEHAQKLPHLEDAALRMGVGSIAMDYVLNTGGTCYVQQRLAAPFLASGVLHPVAGAPVLQRRIFAIYAEDAADAPMVQAGRRLLAQIIRSAELSKDGAPSLVPNPDNSRD